MPTLPTFNRFHFQGQHENEQVEKVIHRHWFNILAHLVTVLILALFLIGSLTTLPAYFPDMLGAHNPAFFAFIETTLFIFLWLYGFLVWIDYFFDVWIITNERIVNIEQRGLFTRDISELQFESVQDVTASVSGLIPTMLNFGDVSVQTAAEKERFIFRQVPDPFAVKDIIMQLSRDTIRNDMGLIGNTLRNKMKSVDPTT